jgi:CheY-like chemotaxis protein
MTAADMIYPDHARAGENVTDRLRNVWLVNLVLNVRLAIVRYPPSNSAGTPMQAFSNVQARSRIAVIDDDVVFVDLMQDLLASGEGYEVVSTPQWLQSFEFIKEVQPDLVILDLMLGREQTGWSVLELLREDPATARIPVILCSAAAPALTHLNAAANGHGALEAVAKPFDVDHILEVIERLLSRGRPSTEY